MVSCLRFFAIISSLILFDQIINQSAICGEANLPSKKALLSYNYIENGIALNITNVGVEPFVVDKRLIVGIRWLFYDEHMHPLQLEAKTSPILPDEEVDKKKPFTFA